MVDLGRPEQYGGSDGVVEIIRVGDHFRVGPVTSRQFDFFVAGEAPMLWRPRFVSVTGDTTAGAGSVALTFQGLVFAGTSDPWPATGGIVAAADREVAAGETYHYTWSTEVADNYSNLDDDFGRVWVGGLPVGYLPQQSTFSILLTSKGGYVGDLHITDGMMQIERFRADKVLGTLDLANIYLLPQNQ